MNLRLNSKVPGSATRETTPLAAIRKAARLASGALLAGALIATAAPAPASAAPASPANFRNIGTAVPSTELTSKSDARGYDDYSCFGIKGTFRDGSVLVKKYWTSSPDSMECFGIAPDYSIWHAWKGSGQYWQMPYGFANRVISAYRESNGDRSVVVMVYSNESYWRSTDPTDSRGWSGWRRIP